MCVWCLLPCGVGVLVCGCVAQFVHLSFVLVCPHPRCDAGRAFAGPPLDDLTCVILCVWCAHHVMYVSVVAVEC